MRVSSTTVALLASLLKAPSYSLGFQVSTLGGGRVAAPIRSNVNSGHQHRLRLGGLFSTSIKDNEATSETATKKKKKKKLGLLTFDLGKNIFIVCLHTHDVLVLLTKQ